MRILLTGATGFLGRHVLADLLADARVHEIVVLSRRSRRHESPKVRVRKLDLTHAADQQVDLAGINCIVHLAGLYDFRASFQQCYEQNVLSTLNLVRAVREEGREIPIHFASTYAVGFRATDLLTEGPIECLPPQSAAYAHTKAIAEQHLAQSGLPVRIFRLGVLMGDSRRGEIDKIDGPYSFMRLALELARHKPLRSLPVLPVPVDPSTVLPMVPVDVAAKVLAESPISDPPITGKPEFYGVYNPGSAPVAEIVQATFDEFLPGTRPIFIRKPLPSALLRAQERVTGVPAEIFEFGSLGMRVDSREFDRRFGAGRIPPFSSLKETWLRGFRNYMDGNFE
jgi:nucleoside-diphosphate-sugar epimerase